MMLYQGEIGIGLEVQELFNSWHHYTPKEGDKNTICPFATIAEEVDEEKQEEEEGGWNRQAAGDSWSEPLPQQSVNYQMKTIGYHGGNTVYIFAKIYGLTVLSLLVDQVLGCFSAVVRVSLFSVMMESWLNTVDSS